MCGIIGVIGRPPSRPVPTDDELIALLDRAVGAIGDPAAVAEAVGAVDAQLRGVPGVVALADRHALVAAITARLDQLDAWIDEHDVALETEALEATELERRSAAAIGVRDALWAVRHDRLRTAREVAALAGRDAPESALAGYLTIQQALSAIDRLEVRGRDSAGIHVFVRGHGLTEDDSALAGALADRSRDPMFQSGSVRFVDGVLSFVYKAAAEIGELGDNTMAAVARRRFADDQLLRRAVARRRLRGACRRARTHPVGERRHHLARPMRTRSTSEETRVIVDGPVRDRTSCRRSTATSTITPISGSIIRCASTSRSPPTRR